MILKDKIDFQGHFMIKAFKKDGSVEVYEDKNLIMDKARSNMAELIGGMTAGQPIDKFSLGNKGHVGSDILNYKKVGANNEFVSTRTMLFAEDPAYADANNDTNGDHVESFVYEITFDVRGDSAEVTDDKAVGRIKGDDATQTCTVKRVVADRTCTYTITIPDNAGNKGGEGEVMPYTEAALYAGPDIFSMKTFPARVKEDTVKFEITWAIIF